MSQHHGDGYITQLDTITSHPRTMSARLPDVIDEDILCCHLCLRPMQRPKLLPCLHLYCQSCLEDYVRRWESGLPGRHSASRPTHNEQYITFPDTPKSPGDRDSVFSDRKANVIGKRFSFPDRICEKAPHVATVATVASPKRSPRRSDNRRSGGSEDGMRKRFQQPERYVDRDVLAQYGADYRERYRKSRNAKSVQAEKQPSNESATLDTKAVNNISTHKKAIPSETSHDGSENKAASRRKDYKRAMSSPQHSSRASVEEGENLPLCGKVSSIVNLYEQKSSASSSREATPPLALFRPKTPTSQTKPPFVPLNKRPLPAVKVKNEFSLPSRSHSFDSLPVSKLSLCPKSASFSTQDSVDSALGTGESEFVDSPVPMTQEELKNRISSISEEDHYEGYEFPQNSSSKDITDVEMTRLKPEFAKSSGSSNDYELAKSADTLPKQEHTLKSGGIKRAKSPTPKLRMPPPPVPQQPTPETTQGTGRYRPVSITENIYYEIPEWRHSRPNSIRTSGSVPDLLEEATKDDSIPADIKRRRLRRSSSSLDSYVMAADLRGHHGAQELNKRIPLSPEDSQRLSQLYMSMDGGRRPSAILSQTSYIAMDNLRSPGIRSPSVFTPESISTLIQALSNEFHGKSAQDDVSVEEDIKSIKSTKSDPPIYANTAEEEAAEKEELDMPIPVYEATRSNPSYVNHNYYNSRQLRKEDKLKYEPNKDIQVPCPTCDRLFFLPKGDVSALQDCSYASQIQEVVQTQKCEKKQCGHCDYKTAHYKCLDCHLYLCSGCQNGHSWSRSNTGHKVITLQELQSGKFQQEIKQLQVTKCDQGCTNVGKHFCAQCDLVMCSDCLIQHSRHHQSCPLDQVAHREQDFIQSMTNNLQTRKEIFHGAVDNLSNYQNHCREARQKVIDDLKAHQEYLYLLLDRSFDFLRSKVVKEYEVELSKSETLKTEVHRSLSSMDHVSNFVRQLTEHGNHGNIVSMAKTIKQEISRLQALNPKVMESQVKVKFQPPEVTLQQVQPHCGDLFVDSDPVSRTDVKLNRQMTELMEHHTHQMELLAQFTTKLEGDKKGCRPNGVAVAPDKDLAVVVDDINKKLKAFNMKGKLLWEICPKDKDALRDPWDVVILGNGTLAVTDKGSNDVKVFTKEGVLVTAFGAHLKKPWGIAQNSKGALIVTDTELRKVFVHDSVGRLLYTLPHQPKALDLRDNMDAQFTLKCPEYVCCNTFDDIIISDFENHRILAFDCLGRPLFKFGKKGKGMDEFHYPLGIATDHNGNIFVVNYQNQRITVVSRNGQFLCCLTSKVTLQSMQTLTINKEGHLVVVDGSMIKIFKLPESIVGSVNRQQRQNQKDLFMLEISDESENKMLGQETTV